jgi:predicted RND superfamily exporter protein
MLPKPKSDIKRFNMDFLDSFFNKLSEFNLRHVKSILVIGFIVVVVSLSGVPRIQIGTSLVNSFKESSQVRHDFYAFNNHLEGANSFDIVLQSEEDKAFLDPKNLLLIESLQKWLDAQKEIGGTTAITDYIKTINQGMTTSDDNYVIPSTKGLVQELIMIGGNDEMDNFIDFDYQSTRIVVNTVLMDSSGIMNLINKIIKYMDSNIPKNLNPQVTGNTYLVAKTMDDIAYGQVVSILTAFIIIYLMLSVLFMSFKTGLIALIPNVIPVLIYFGILGWSGIELNVTTGLVACIVFGIAVDDTIHLMAHFNKTAKERANIPEGVTHALKSVGKPVTFTTIALCLGFLCMLLSEMRTQMEFGLLAAATLFCAWVVDVTFTPAIASHMKIVTLWDVLSLDLDGNPQKIVRLFNGLTARQAKIVSLLSVMSEYKAGEEITPINNGMYVIADGELNITCEYQDGSTFVDMKGRGFVLGDNHAFNKEYKITVYANRDTTILNISKQNVDYLKKRYPKIAHKIHQNLDENIDFMKNAEIHKPEDYVLV